MYQKTLVIVGVFGVFLSLVLGLLSYITWEVVAVLITVSLGIPGRLIASEKLKPESRAKPSVEKREQVEEQASATEEKEIPARRETIVVSPTESYFYEFELLRGDLVRFRMKSLNGYELDNIKAYLKPFYSLRIHNDLLTRLFYI